MGFDAGTGVSVRNAISAEAVGRLAAVSVASCLVALLMFFFAIVFPFVCPYPNVGACDDANQHTGVKSGVAPLAPAMNSVVYPQPNLTDRIDIDPSVTLSAKKLTLSPSPCAPRT